MALPAQVNSEVEDGRSSQRLGESGLNLKAGLAKIRTNSVIANRASSSQIVVAERLSRTARRSKWLGSFIVRKCAKAFRISNRRRRSRSSPAFGGADRSHARSAWGSKSLPMQSSRSLADPNSRASRTQPCPVIGLRQRAGCDADRCHGAFWPLPDIWALMSSTLERNSFRIGDLFTLL